MLSFLKNKITNILVLLLLPSFCFAEISWEKIYSGKLIHNYEVIYRTQVPHGWLVLFGSRYLDVHDANMIFVPDENHEWQQ